MREINSVPLGCLGKTYPGLSGKTKNDFGSGSKFIPYLNVFKDGKIDTTFWDYVKVNKNEKQYKVKFGDLFFTTSSETIEEVGMTSVLLDYLDEDIYLNSFCFGFRLNNFDILDPGFARFLFRSTEIRKQISNFGQGSTRYNLPKTEMLRKLILNLPSVSIQQKIAKILSTIDGQIEKTEAIIAKYQAVKQGMLQDLFTCGVDVATGKLRPKYEDAPELYKDSVLGMIPMEWEVDVLGAKAIIQYGKSQKAVVSQYGKIPVYGTGGLMEYATDYLHDGESILIGRKGTIDKPYYITGKFWTVDTAYYLESFAGNVRWLHLKLLDFGLKRLNEATGVPSINREQLYKIRLAFPDFDEQCEIIRRINPIEDKIANDEQCYKKLVNLKKGLMSDLLSGKVEVKE